MTPVQPRDPHGRGRLLGPVAIGGVGGSGTRVVAQLLREVGFYLGGDLNGALDNRWFTLLFKRPDWYQRSRARGDASIHRTIDAFVDVMLRGRRGTVAHLPLIVAAASQLARTGHDRSGFGSGTWPFRRVATMLAAPVPGTSTFAGWGWKEPNTHLFVPELVAAIPGLRYIHVVRHGLDMAFSGNQNQLYNFGWLVNNSEQPPVVTPEASLDFWIAANERAISLGRQLLGDRFLVVNIDTLWRDAVDRIAELIAFLGQDHDDALVQRLARLPTRPSTTGRYRHEDLSRFSRAQLDAVEALGFDIDHGRPSPLAGDSTT